MKKQGFYLFVIIVLFVMIAMTGCAPRASVNEEGKVTVITTFFPLYDFAGAIGGEYVNVVNLVPAGVDPHDWEPKSRDMMNISKAQLLLYQGAGFEGWMDEVLSGIDTKSMVIVEASQGIDLIDVTQADERIEEGHDHDHEHDHGLHDPHTWLSPRSALTMARNVLNGLKEADPENTAQYEMNFAALEADLLALDQKFSEQLSNVSNKEMVVSHQAFGYLARDYGLVQMPLSGITAEGEPTSQDLVEISKFVKEHGVTHIFVEQFASVQLAKTLAEDLGLQTLPLHPLEGLTEDEAASGETYISLMERNLEQLVTALK